MAATVWKPSVEIRDSMEKTARWLSGPLADRLIYIMGNGSSPECYTECFIAVLYIVSASAHPKYNSESKRYSSFPQDEDWQQTGNGQSVRSFVEAGFFLVGQDSDHVKCFFCNLGLKDWSAGDDPLFEHARFSPLCFYIKSMKGLQYLEEVATRRSEPVTFPSVYRQPNHGGLLDKLIIDLWKSDVVKSVISVGIHPNDVLLRVSRVWIRERRSENVENLVTELQENGGSCGPEDEMNLVPVAENYYKFYVSIQREFSSTRVTSTTRSRSPRRQQPPAQPPQPEKVKESSITEVRYNRMNSSDRGEGAQLGATPQNNSAGPESGYKTRNPDLNRKTCYKCNMEEFSMTCLPCAHLCMCHSCANKTKRCPICNSIVRMYVRTYIT